MNKADRESFRYIMEWNAANDAYWKAHPEEFHKATTYDWKTWQRKLSVIRYFNKKTETFADDDDL